MQTPNPQFTFSAFSASSAAQFTFRLLSLLAAACLGVTGCAELNWHGNNDDYIGPAASGYRHLEPLPASYHYPQTQATQPAPGSNEQSGAATQPDPYATTQPAPSAGPLDLTVQSAILTTLEHNLALKVDRFNPPIQRTAVDQQLAAFDPDLTASASASRSRTSETDLLEPNGTQFTLTSPSRTDFVSANAGVSEFLPTGTTIQLQGGMTDYNADNALPNSFSAGPSLTVTQSLLRGGGLGVNLASLRQARVDVLSSQYELRGLAESLIEQAENTYWDYTLAQRQISIVTNALDVAQQQLYETTEMIRLGKLGGVELASAQAAVAQRREDLINAKSALATTRINLLRLLNPGDGQDMWDRAVNLVNNPFVPQGGLDPVDAHVQVALHMRPDLNQARLQVQRGDLQVVKTRNGLLPRLDFFITLGKTGYSDSFTRAIQNVFSGDSYDMVGGLNFELPVGDRAAGAQDLAAHLTRDQAIQTVHNLEQLVQVDVRTQYIEVERTRQQIDATAATRHYQEEQLRNEKVKFRVGKSTSLLVAQAEQDLLTSQIDEVQAVVGHLKALVTLFRMEGSLLERRGIQAPGGQAVDPYAPAPGVDAAY